MKKVCAGTLAFALGMATRTVAPLSATPELGTAYLDLSHYASCVLRQICRKLELNAFY